MVSLLDREKPGHVFSLIHLCLSEEANQSWNLISMLHSAAVSATEMSFIHINIIILVEVTK